MPTRENGPEVPETTLLMVMRRGHTLGVQPQLKSEFGKGVPPCLL
jgi:hypothetical protein